MQVKTIRFPALFFLGFALFFLAFTNDTSEHQIWFLACSTFARRIMHGFRRQEHARNTAHGIYPCRCLHHPHYFRLADETPNIMRPMMTDCPRPPVSPSAWSSMAPWSGTCPAQHIRVHQAHFYSHGGSVDDCWRAREPATWKLYEIISRRLGHGRKLLIATLVSSDPRYKKSNILLCWWCFFDQVWITRMLWRMKVLSCSVRRLTRIVLEMAGPIESSRMA